MPDANVGDNGPRLRQGRRVPEHVYLMLGPEPSNDDTPLVTLPSADLARWLVAAVELAERHADVDLQEAAHPIDPVAYDEAWEARAVASEAYRRAREAIR